MRHTIKKLKIVTGQAAGQLRHPRVAFAIIRAIGLREYIAVQRATFHLSFHIGPVETLKLLRTIRGIVTEHYPHIDAFHTLLKYASVWVAPPHSMNPKRIAAICHQMVRSMVNASLPSQCSGVKSHE